MTTKRRPDASEQLALAKNEAENWRLLYEVEKRKRLEAEHALPIFMDQQESITICPDCSYDFRCDVWWPCNQHRLGRYAS